MAHEAAETNASRVPVPGATQAGTLLGTPGWMAPGQQRGERADAAADVARWLDDEPVLAYREAVLERGRRLVHRHRAPLLLIAGYVVMRWIVYVIART